MEEINGFLLVNKPKGWTSFDVVAKVRGILTREKRAMHVDRKFCTEGAKPDDNHNCRCKVKVGHSGTLDPMATGLLILAIGKATKQIDSVMKLDKVYDVELTLGKTSTTDDQEGEITDTGNDIEIEDMKFFDDVLISFIGEIQQVPPIYSAIKIDGKRAYKMAREGKKPKMEPRTVTIKSITKVDYNHPKVLFEADVSSGTYIRSLARDIGEKLGTGAYMSELKRLSVGEFKLESAIDPEQESDTELFDKIKHNLYNNTT